MLWFNRPDDEALTKLTEQLRAKPLSYELGLLDRVADEPTLPRHRGGWFVDRFEERIGTGADDFAAACDGLRGWQQFDRDWLAMTSDHAPLEVDATVAYAARVLSTWWGYGCRILKVIDEPTRFGFVYGTIEGHAECGEELFLVEMDGSTDAVTYSLFAMSRPGRWFSWPGMPIARRAQGRFRPTSAASMRRAVSNSRAARESPDQPPASPGRPSSAATGR